METCLATNISHPIPIPLPETRISYIFSVTHLEYLSEVFWVAEFRGNWISYINLIPRSFWVWQRRILFWSQAVFAFYYTKRCNEVKEKKNTEWTYAISSLTSLFSFENLETCETHLARIYCGLREKVPIQEGFTGFILVLPDFIGLFCFKAELNLFTQMIHA